MDIKKNCVIKLTIFSTYEKIIHLIIHHHHTSLAMVSLLFLAKEVLDKLNQAPPQLLPPPTFLTLSVNYLLLTLTILANTDRSGTVINQLFPNFRGIRNRGRDVWQILEFNPIVFWYMTGETAEAMVEKVYLDIFAPRHLPRTPRTDRRRRCILDALNRSSRLRPGSTSFVIFMQIFQKLLLKTSSRNNRW